MKNIVSLILFLTFSLFCLPVFAANSTVIDVQGFLDESITGVFAFLSTIALGLLGYVWGKSKSLREQLHIDDSIRSYLEKAIQSGIQYAQNKAIFAAKDIKNPDVQNEIIANAINYVLPRVPDALNHFGIDARDLADMILARLKLTTQEEVLNNVPKSS